MILILRTVIGIVFVCGGALLFVFGAANLNRSQSFGGAMSGASSTTEIITSTAILATIAVCLIFGGVKLAKLKKKPVGVILTIIGCACLIFGAVNHLNAPPSDGANDTGRMPVDAVLHFLTYLAAGICLLPGVCLLSERENVQS